MSPNFLVFFAIVGFVYGQTTQQVVIQSATGQTSSDNPKPEDYVIVKNTDREDGLDRIYLQQPKDRYISIWHGIPMLADKENKIYNMVVEVPRGEMDKYRMDLSLPMNPLVEQPERITEEDPIDYIHSYGILPQSFIGKDETDAISGMKGNGMPLHVVEISENAHREGAVVRVKILGALGVTNEAQNMIDYKLVGIDANSPLAATLKNLDDVEAQFPDLLASTRGFFRYYRYPEISQIANKGDYLRADDAEKIIDAAHQSWDRLIKLPEAPEKINTETRFPGAAHPVDEARWTAEATAKN